MAAVFKLRLISLTKRPGQGFGFFLRAEQGEAGHLIRSLEMGGPAELGGLRDGDRIVRVNGAFVDAMSHSQVVDLVKDSGVSVSFHVLDGGSYVQAKADGVDLSDPSAPRPPPAVNGLGGPGPAPRPKLCYLLQNRAGYSFSLRSVRGEPGSFITEVTPGGVAEKAGVKVRDRLVELNGENVESAPHEAIVERIKVAGGSIMLLLVDQDTDRYYKSKCLAIGAGQATIKHLPQKPRIADMTKGPDGYGFSLRIDPVMTGHYIMDIDALSPADTAGLKEKDRLVAVDGQEVDGSTHEQVVERIRNCGAKCCLLVVDAETDSMYKMGGVSPLLYWEEARASLLPPSYPEAIAMPTLTLTAPSTPEKREEEKGAAEEKGAEPRPRLCRMEMAEGIGYGFHLNGIQGVNGQHVKEVVSGGAADRAGLADDDVVVEVNGVNVERSGHEEVVALIRAGGASLELLVADERAYARLSARGVTITRRLVAAAPVDSASPPPSPVREHKPPAAVPKEEVTEEKEEEEEEKKEARAETPPAQTRERTPSAASSSSDVSIDERF